MESVVVMCTYIKVGSDKPVDPAVHYLGRQNDF